MTDLDYGRGTFVLVGCGAAKADEPRPAKDLYTSTYFALKRRFAEAATAWITEHGRRGNGWMILSAKHGIWPPRLELDPYDLTVDDLDGDELDRWARRVRSGLIDWLRGPFRADEPEDSPCKHLIVLAGERYVAPLRERDAFQATEKHRYGVPAQPQFPFQDGDFSGIGEQMAWLKEMVPVVDATPPKPAELGSFGAGYERDRAAWQFDREFIDPETTEQASLGAFEDVDERYLASEQQSLVTDGGFIDHPPEPEPCPDCGYPVEACECASLFAEPRERYTVACENCNTELEVFTEECPHCGFNRRRFEGGDSVDG